jgi:hypothetical protein
MLKLEKLHAQDFTVTRFAAQAVPVNDENAVKSETGEIPEEARGEGA